MHRSSDENAPIGPLKAVRPLPSEPGPYTNEMPAAEARTRAGLRARCLSIALFATGALFLLAINLASSAREPQIAPAPQRAGISCQTFTRTGSRIPIPDGDTQGITSTLFVPAFGYVSNITLTIPIDHEWHGDLVGELCRPNGCWTTVFNEDLSGEGNLTWTFNDNASGYLDEVSNPEPAKPDAPLMTKLYGKGAAGRWKLHVVDRYAWYSGSLGNWSVTLCTGNTPAPTLTPWAPARPVNCADVMTAYLHPGPGNETPVPYQAAYSNSRYETWWDSTLTDLNIMDYQICAAPRVSFAVDGSCHQYQEVGKNENPNGNTSGGCGYGGSINSLTPVPPNAVVQPQLFGSCATPAPAGVSPGVYFVAGADWSSGGRIDVTKADGTWNDWQRLCFEVAASSGTGGSTTGCQSDAAGGDKWYGSYQERSIALNSYDCVYHAPTPRPTPTFSVPCTPQPPGGWWWMW